MASIIAPEKPSAAPASELPEDLSPSATAVAAAFATVTPNNFPQQVILPAVSETLWQH